MANCLPACCDDFEGVTKADKDQFTDRIENVLNDEQGRRLFRIFMEKSKLSDGLKALDFWENIDKLINSTKYVKKHLDRLMDEAEKIGDIDSAKMASLQQAHDSANKEALDKVLKDLKPVAVTALRTKYGAFRRHLLSF